MNTPTNGERQAIWLITAIGVISRLVPLWQPMRYDESVTWAYFVGRPWSTIVSSYPFPNNHVLFSLLAKATSSLAPFQPWALRLPAFIAGVVIVPLVWAVGRRVASPAVGLLGAALAAGSTTLILYSTNARGYSMVVALFLMLLLVADRLRESGRLVQWGTFALLGALGLYTIPIMLYPLGVVCTWLLLAAARTGSAERHRLVVGVVLGGVAAGVIALLLYLPIVQSAGLGALVGNRFVTPSPWIAFAADLPRHAAKILVTWTSPLPWWMAPMMLLAALAGLFPGEQRDRPSLALATTLWCVLLLAATHRVPFVRVWLFLLPLFHLAVAHGVVRLLSRTRIADAIRSPRSAIVLAAGVATLALLSDTVRSSDDTGAFRSASVVAASLAPALRPGDRVLAPIPTNGPLLYYFGARGLDTALFNTPPAETRRAFLVLDPARGRTLAWAVSVGMIDPAMFREPALVLRRDDVELWQTERR